MFWIKRIIPIVLGLLLFAFAGSVLQRTTVDLFASPDETAVMSFARAWEFGEGFRLPHGLPPELVDIASLHPRSMVRQGDVLVPVGFLGMPFIVSLAEMIAHGFGAYVTLILVLSAVYPLWRFARKTSPRVAVLTAIIFLAFPTVLLYVNRGLFPNLPVVALATWAVWAVSELKGRDRRSVILAIVAGMSLGLAFVIRPIEAVWIIPWIVWAFWMGRDTAHPHPHTPALPYFIAGGIAFIICLFGVFLAMKTYPFHAGIADQPVAGYFLKDIIGSEAAPVSNSGGDGGLSRFLPFGFHPRVMWENIRVFLFGYLGLWTAAAFLGAFFVLRKQWNKETMVFLALCGWTFAALLLFYGQSAYADNIQGNPALGNSFLRYLLPLVPLMSYGTALFLERLWSLRHRGRIIGMSAACFFVLLGIAFAFAHDEESITRTRYELERYVLIRDQAERTVQESAIILSERSDKIFASGPFVSVSPIPADEDLLHISEGPVSVYLFHRTFTGDDPLEERLAELFGEPRGLFTLNNETFYQLSAGPLNMSTEEASF